MDLRKRFPNYNRLLYLYPTAYRQRYKEQMLQTLADMLDDAPSKSQRIAVWSRIIADLPISVMHQQVTYTGAVMTQDTPKYVKNSTLLGTIMLLPFFIILAAASIDKNLRQGTLWHFHVLFTFFVALPTLAFLLAVVAFISWIVERHQKEQRSWLREVIDIRRNWPLLGVIIVGLGIVGMVYGHDSVHCVTGNPIREIQQAHQTLRCIEQR